MEPTYNKNDVVFVIPKEQYNIGDVITYKKDNEIVIRSDGIKWIYEKYYRKEYLSELEYYKNHLDTLYK